jgi:PAS domain S-box-containing protein
MKKTHILFAILFCFLSNAFSQKNVVDSLLNNLKNAKNDSIKCELYIQLGKYFKSENSDTTLYYYNQSLKLAITLDLKKQEANALLHLGIFYKTKGIYDKALDYQLKSLKISKELGNKKEFAVSNTNIGNVYYYQGIYDKAIEYYLKSLKVSEELKDSINICNSYYNIGNVYADNKLLEKAIEYYFKSLKISEELKDENGVADCYTTIGLIYLEKKQFVISLEYHNKSLVIYKKLKNNLGISGCFSNIGLVYASQGLYDNAVSNYKKSLQIFEEIGDKNGVMDCYLNIAEMNLLLADSAALTETQRLKFLNNSVEYGTKAFDIAKEINALPFENTAAKQLMTTFKKLGNYQKSTEFAQIYITTKDSMLSEEKSKIIAELGVKYEDEKKQLKIENLEKENIIQLEKSRKQNIINYALAIGLILLLGFVILIYRNYSQKKKANKILEEKNQLINTQKEEILGQSEELKSVNEYLLDVNANLEKLSIVAQKTENAVTIMDGNGNLLWANDAFESLYEISFDDYIAKHGNNIVTATMNPEAKNLISDCINTGKFISYTTFFVLKNGNERWSQTHITPILDNNGKVYKLVAVDSDITELKNAEQEIIIKNKKITDSISYAKKIQEAFLPDLDIVKKYLSATFVFYQPRDIVSGDFYWFYHLNGKSVCVLADCTGHGVPGAFMSMIGNTLLNEIVINQKILEPAKILEILDRETKKTLHSESDNENDGMSISVCVFDVTAKTVRLACAEQSILIIENGEPKVIEGSFYGIGFGHPKEFPFTEHEFKIKENQTIYMFSDGYSDQFGGYNGKKFMLNNFIKLLQENVNLPMNQQSDVIKETLNQWVNKENREVFGLKNGKPISYSQIDDITVWGIKML